MIVARHGTAHHAEKLVATYRRCKRLEDGARAGEPYRSRELSVRYDEDGSLILKGRFPPDTGAMIVKALEKAMQQATKRPAQAVPGPAGDDPVTGVSAETSWRIACDCAIVALVEDDDGEPLSIGRKSRSIPPALRRAMKARDQGFRFPGCTHRYRIDGHHVEHRADGGETSLKNLVQLCRHHHVLVHEGGFDCERGDDGPIVFTNPRGAAIPRSVEPLSLSDQADVARWVDGGAFDLDIDPDIDRHTCVPQWAAGDDIDRDLAVAHLFACLERLNERVGWCQSAQCQAGRSSRPWSTTSVCPRVLSSWIELQPE